MSNKTIQLHLGIGACIACVFLLAVAIPDMGVVAQQCAFSDHVAMFWPAMRWPV